MEFLIMKRLLYMVMMEVSGLYIYIYIYLMIDYIMLLYLSLG